MALLCAQSATAEEFYETAPTETTPEPLTIRADEEALSVGMFMKQSDLFPIWLTNDRKDGGVVEFYASAGSHLWIVEQHPIEKTEIYGGETKVAYIRIDSLNLSDEPLHFSGGITIEAKIFYYDGTVNNSEEPISLYFHPENGGFWVYNKKALNELFDGGYLTGEAKDLRETEKKKAEEAGEPFEGIAYAYSYGTNDDAGAEGSGDGGSVILSGSIKFCIQVEAEFNDNGYGEDYLTSDGYYYAKGQYVIIKRETTQIFNGYLYDGLNGSEGCTGYLTVPDVNATYYIWAYSGGSVNSNTITVRDPNGVMRYIYLWVTVSGQSSPHTRTVSISKAMLGSIFGEFNVYSAANYAMYRHNGGMTNKTYDFQTIDGPSENRSGIIYIRNSTGNNHTLRKFVITHEMGHRVHYYGVGNNQDKVSRSGDYDWPGYDNPPAPCLQDSRTSHYMNSREYNRAACTEGFGHFYGAISFNNTAAGADCKFKYYKTIINSNGNQDVNPTIDCQDGQSGYPLQYMENHCYFASDPFAGDGVELDWLRMWWDFLTKNVPGATKPTFANILGMMNYATTWTQTTTYTRLDEAAFNYQSGLYENQWNNVVSNNGVDW
ncbi:MAG: hypothetical protein Kow0090_08230 [Myxococcota bacterium]